MRTFQLLFALGFLSAAATGASATVIHVPGDQPSIQSGIDAAGDGDSVLVAPGTYTGEGNREIRPQEKGIFLASAGGSGATTIDLGPAGGTGILMEGVESNPRTAVRGFTITRASIGVEVQGGHARLTDLAFTNGGGVQIGPYGELSVAISRCDFHGNGLGIGPFELPWGQVDVDSCLFQGSSVNVWPSLLGSDPTVSIANSTFLGAGTAVSNGGYGFSGLELTVDGCTFDGNGTAFYGIGAMRDCVITNGTNGFVGYVGPTSDHYSQVSGCYFSGMTGTVIEASYSCPISSCDFVNNTGTIISGTSWDDVPLYCTIAGCRFEGNSGGVDLSGVRTYVGIHGCTYTRNGAPISIATWDWSSGPDINDCTFAENLGRVLDISLSSVNATLSRCAFIGNGGDAVTVSGHEYAFAADHNTIADNGAAGIVFPFCHATCSNTVANCIISGNSGPGLQVDASCTVACQANDVFVNRGGNYVGLSDQTGQNGNISADPMFCDREAADYHISVTSPCHPDSGSYGLIGALGVGCWPTPRVCCLSSGCQLLLQEECLSAGGVWHSAWESCDPFPCTEDLAGPMVPVPAGSFVMGDGVAPCGTDEREVTLTRGFSIGRHLVTNQEWLEAVQWAYDAGYVTATASTVRDALDGSTVELIDLDDEDCEIEFDGAGTFRLRCATSSYAQEAYPYGYDPTDHPVIEITWFGAARYCDWLSLRHGLPRSYQHTGNWLCNGGDPYAAPGYRLATDAEYEFAAQYDDERSYPWGSEEPDCGRANFSDGQYCVGWTSPAGRYPNAPETLGLSDMAGNAYEFVNDRFTCDLGTTPATDPVGPETGASAVRRGGSWANGEPFLRCASRQEAVMAGSSNIIGFRAARTTTASAAPTFAASGRNRLTVPNPAHPGMQIQVEVAAPALVRMDIYRVSGELIRTMSLGVLPSGFHHVVWDGRTEMGTKAGSGLYCLRARIGSEVLTQKTILLR